MSNRESQTPSPEHQTPAPESWVAGVRFQPTGKVYGFDATGCGNLRPGDFVLVETARGQQLGEVVSVQPLREGENKQDLKPVQRRATGHDLAIRQHWQLVQRLQRTLGVRVDLRRIGPRDHAKLMGGYGACGESRCCARFLSEFSPVSIKMAKTQGVSLNPSDITGMCGRLRCCLVYEEEQYREACQLMPRRRKRVRTPHGEGKVVDLLPLKGVVVVQVEDRRLEVPVEDVELIST